MKQYLKFLVNLFGYKINKILLLDRMKNDGRITDLDVFNIFIENQILKEKTNFNFIQIGANDGITSDPIYHNITKYKPNGILIEPQREVFNTLINNYKNNENLSFFNFAISDSNSERILYKVDDTFHHRSSCLKGVASFSKDHVIEAFKYNVKDKVDEIDFLSEEVVTTKTFDKLLEISKFDQISLLQIDAESYDYHILVQMFNSKVRPGIVNFEVKMMSDNEKEFVVGRFVQEGYKLYRHGIDLMAYKV